MTSKAPALIATFMCLLAVSHAGQSSFRKASRLSQLPFKTPPAPTASGAQGADLVSQYLSGIFDLSNTCQHPVRLGRPNDGGYLMCEDALPQGGPQQGCELFSYGIANDDSFDRAVYDRYHCEVQQFDPTVSGSTGSKMYPQDMHFHKEGLADTGPKQQPGLGMVDSLPHHVAKYPLNHRVFVLKVDVEESEWSAFRAIPDSFWGTVDQALIELHTTVTKPAHVVAAELASRVDVVNTLKKHFDLFHVHMNNWEPKAFIPGSVPVPQAVELSFMRKGLMAPATPPYDNHSELDQPCKPGAREVTPADFGK